MCVWVCVRIFTTPLLHSHFGSFMSVLDILLCSLSTFIHIDNKICLVGPSPTQTAFHANLISAKALRCPCRCRLLWLQGMGIEVCVGGGGMGSLFVLTVFISSFQLVFFLFRLKCIYFFPRSFFCQPTEKVVFVFAWEFLITITSKQIYAYVNPIE